VLDYVKKGEVMTDAISSMDCFAADFLMLLR
jgi:hypothetical protein